jgi:acetate kinase
MAAASGNSTARAETPSTVLILNGGSSSLKFALFSASRLERRWSGTIDEAHTTARKLSAVHADGRRSEQALAAGNGASALGGLMDWLEAHQVAGTIVAVGHRVVHGMDHGEPERVTPALLEELRRLAPMDPDHLPAEIAMIDGVSRRYPDLAQVVCFDTAFHRDLPRVARLLPIPRRYDAQGIRRYGFHGLSYAYLMEELERRAGADAARGRVVLAHLGSGASMAAVLDGRSLDTSMGFTPTGGLPMSTRCGDLDPGVAAYLARSGQLSTEAFFTMASRESGLLGMSSTSADMRELLKLEASDVRAAEAIAVFCYQAKKCIGAYAAVLGGLDTLVFSGGIGEHADVVRSRICAGLDFLGIELDAARNAAHAAVISAPTSRATVRVIRTDEESMIARSVARVLQLEP